MKDTLQSKDRALITTRNILQGSGTANPLQMKTGSSEKSLSSNANPLQQSLAKSNPLQSFNQPRSSLIKHPWTPTNTMVIQMVKWGKLLSFFKKNQSAHIIEKPVEQEQEVEDTADSDYVNAYKKARLYHGTNNREGVEKEGLLTKYGGTGLNNAPFRENRVFLGINASTSDSYGRGENLGRVFLPPERTKANQLTDRINNRNIPIPSDKKGEMFKDPENPSAFFTENDIPPQQIQFPHGEQGLKDSENFENILSTIGQHMKNPKTVDEMKELHENAVRNRAISLLAGDNPNSKHTRQWKPRGDEVDPGID